MSNKDLYIVIRAAVLSVLDAFDRIYMVGKYKSNIQPVNKSDNVAGVL